MGGKKISALIESTTVPSNSYTIIVDGTVNKKIKLETITKDLSDRVDTQDTTINNLSNRIDTQDTTINNLSNRIDTQDTTINNLSNRIDGINIQDTTISNLSNKVNNQETAITNLSNKVNAQGTTITNLSNKVNTQETTIGNLSDRVDGINNQDTAITNLSNKVNTQETTINNLSNKVNEQVTTITNLSNRVDTQETTITNLSNKVNEQETITRNLNSSLAEINTEINNIKSRLDNIGSGSTDIDNTLANINTEINNIKSRLNNIENGSTGSTDVNNTLANINTEINNIKSRLNEIENNSTDVDTALTNTNTEISSIKSRLSNVENSSTNINAEINSIKSRLDEIGSGSTNVGTEIENIKSRLNNIETSSSNTNTEISSIKSRLNKVETASTSTNTEISSIKSRLSSVETSSNNTNTEIENLKSRLSSIETASTDTTTEISSIKSRLSSVETSSSNVDSKIANINTEINSIKSSMGNIKNDSNMIADGETIQQAIDRVSNNGGTLKLENKTYTVTSTLTIDVSKLSIDGNGATIDFSQAPSDTNCFKLISTANTPYLNNGHFIKSLEIVGKGKTYTQTAFICDSDIEARATSHLDFEKLNIHEFGTGFNFKRYCYMLRFHSVDIFNTGVCLDMPANGADTGENFNFYGCGLFNSDTVLRCRNTEGSFHFTACSIDYVSYAFDMVSSSRVTFMNGHIEGGCKIKGNANIIGSWLVYTNAENMFEGDEKTKINIDKCFLNTSTIGKVLTNGLVKVKFTDCRYLDVDNYSTNKLNSTSLSVDSKFIDLYAFGGTSDNTDKLTMGNCAISVDMNNKETGDRCYKITKQYGAGSYCTFRLLLPRDKRCTKVNLNIRIKANKSLSGIGVTFSTVNFIGYQTNGVPYWLANKVFGNVTLSLTTSYTTLTLNNNTSIITNNDDYYAVDFDLFNCETPIVYIDNVQLYEF